MEEVGRTAGEAVDRERPQGRRRSGCHHEGAQAVARPIQGGVLTASFPRARSSRRADEGGGSAAPVLALEGIPLERRLKSQPALAHADRRERRSKEWLIASWPKPNRNRT